MELTVLSLFDGISCGQLALQRAGIDVKVYLSSEIDKYAKQVTKINFPNTIQLGDVKNIKGEDLPKIDLLIGGSPCFTGSNLVLTSKGYVPISEIEVGDMVVTHKNRYKKVLKIGGDVKDTVRVKAQGSTEIITTSDHPFYYTHRTKEWNNELRNYNTHYSDFDWKPISDFSKDDRVVSFKWNNEIDIPDLTNIDLYILGRFLADGHCYKTKRKERKDSHIYKFKISIGKHELEDFKSKVDDRFSYIEERTTWNAFIYQKKWVDLGEKFGKRAENKFIPNFILNLPADRLEIFLQGYMDGDGHIRKSGHKRNTTVSEKLALTLSLAVQKCYHGSYINLTVRKPYCDIEGRQVRQKNTYSVTYHENELKQNKFKIIGDKVCYNISSYVYTNQKEQVYNIEVEDDNSYIVNNLIVHNCQGFSSAGKGLNFNDPRSALFFEYVRILKETKPTYFLLENVKMKKEWQDIITEALFIAEHGDDWEKIKEDDINEKG